MASPITTAIALAVRLYRGAWWKLCLSLVLAGSIAACNQTERVIAPEALNSFYSDEQPAISGNGRIIAFVSNRAGKRQIRAYDLERSRFIDLSGLNQRDTIPQHPSLSQTGRYLVYLAAERRGRPEIRLYDRLTRRSRVLMDSDRGGMRHPSISPDGRYIVFESGESGQWDLKAIDRGTNIELDRPDGATD